MTSTVPVTAQRGFKLSLFSILNLGVSSGITAREQKQIQFTNIVSLMTMVGVLGYVPYSFISGNYQLGILQTIDAVCVSLVFVLNYYHHINAARVVFMLVVNAFVLINSCFIGPEGRVQDFFVLSNIIPLMIYRITEVRKIILGSGIAVGCYILYHLIYPYFTEINLPIETQRVIAQINVVMDFGLFGASIFMLVRHNHEVEEVVQKQNAELQLQKDELQRSNEDLEQFAYVISHDLQVPVRNVQSFLRLLEQRHGEALQPEAKEFIAQAGSGSQRVERLIDDLLKYCRVDRNLPPAATVQTEDLVKTIAFEMQDRLRESNAQIIVTNELPAVRNLHATLVYRLFQNLITNGLKFNRNAAPTVTIGTRSTDKEHIFCVADNGIGIPEAQRTNLFQMFRRLHSEKEFAGTGMGLAICKKIVQFYGGHIWIESTEGQGTTFCFSFPK